MKIEICRTKDCRRRPDGSDGVPDDARRPRAHGLATTHCPRGRGRRHQVASNSGLHDGEVSGARWTVRILTGVAWSPGKRSVFAGAPNRHGGANTVRIVTSGFVFKDEYLQRTACSQDPYCGFGSERPVAGLSPPVRALRSPRPEPSGRPRQLPVRAVGTPSAVAGPSRRALRSRRPEPSGQRQQSLAPPISIAAGGALQEPKTGAAWSRPKPMPAGCPKTPKPRNHAWLRRSHGPRGGGSHRYPKPEPKNQAKLRRPCGNRCPSSAQVSFTRF
jgi:hypothetical protein